MESSRTEITLGDLEAHTKRHGSKATSQLLALLGRNRPLYEIANSEGGKKMFGNLMQRMDDLLEKIIENKASDEERMEYSISLQFFRYNVNLLVNYDKHVKMLKGVK